MDLVNNSVRVDRLRERCIRATPEICAERARFLTQSYKETETLPIAIRRAKALEKILTNMSIFVYPDELIVGNHTSKLRAAPIFPEFDVEYIEKEIDGFTARRGDAFQVDSQVKKEILNICKYCRGS